MSLVANLFVSASNATSSPYSPGKLEVNLLAALRNLLIFLTGLSSFSAFFFFFTVALEVTGS